ncbi:coiled-coil domain-containing protein C6orf97 [Clonorchis sinensis]|uniref:Coiled-coil domain-containing protein C6orf97 n=1 Tax=Clonorchis sinensis TaxID=79923 RepID=H2KUD0_CLOSI|nr:coiled-coil domain-containing protein C6orf97 [Clonorchis sinensis]
MCGDFFWKCTCISRQKPLPCDQDFQTKALFEDSIRPPVKQAEERAALTFQSGSFDTDVCRVSGTRIQDASTVVELTASSPSTRFWLCTSGASRAAAAERAGLSTTELPVRMTSHFTLIIIITMNSMTSVFSTDASLPYNHDLLESIFVKKRIKSKSHGDPKTSPHCSLIHTSLEIQRYTALAQWVSQSSRRDPSLVESCIDIFCHTFSRINTTSNVCETTHSFECPSMLCRLNSANFVQPSPKYTEAGGRSAEKLEQIRSQVEKLHQVVDENKGIIHEKNSIICDLRAENEKIRVDNLRSTQRIEELEQQMEEQVERINSYKAAEEQHDKVIHTIQQDVKAKNNKLLNLMSQLRSSEARFVERLASEEVRVKSLEGALADLSHILECEPTAEQCILKVTELVRKMCAYKTQLDQRKDAIQAFEYEQRASRETILRLSGELTKEKNEKASANEESRKAREELVKTQSAHEQCGHHICLLEGRINDLTDSLQAARTEAEEKDKMFALLNEAETKLQAKKIPSASSCGRSGSSNGGTQLADIEAFGTFLKNVAEFFEIPNGEDSVGIVSFVWNRIQEMREDVRNYSDVKELQTDVARLSQLQTFLHENEQSSKQRIQSLEEQRASDGAIIDGLRAERNQLHDLLCKFALAMKFEEPIAETETNIVGQTLIARITQLQQGNTEKQAKQRIQITKLQRELRESKELAESLELQVSIMKRRLAEAQEHRFQNIAPASQTPMTLAASEKERNRLVKQLKQTKDDADKLREEIVLLKARLLESSQEKLTQTEQGKVLKVTQIRMNEINRNFEEQKQEALKLRTELDQWKKRYNTEVKKLQDRLTESERELVRTKEALEINRNSTEQLLNFRSLIARHLGLDSEHLSVPDYEILVKLNKLISSNHTITNRILATENALTLVDGSFRERLFPTPRILRSFAHSRVSVQSVPFQYRGSEGQHNGRPVT